MVNNRTLMDSKIVFVSSSIANWEDKILKKYQAKKYNNDTEKDVIFFGMYSFNDYKRVFKHKGKATIVWCGADILYLRQWKNLWRKLISLKKVKHICENEVQQEALKRYGIFADIKYNFFGDTKDFPVSFKPSKKPQVFMHCPKGREREYGLHIVGMIAKKVPEITFHVYQGYTSEEEFNEEIKGFHAGIRLNQEDGFSEILAKSILLGQYPISFIKYPHMDVARSSYELLDHLKELKNKKVPNPAREWWVKELNKI